MMWRRLLTVALLLLVSSCGFHLRGEMVLPEVMARTKLVAPAGSLVRYEVENLLLGAGGVVTEEESSATAVLTLHSERILSRVLSVDALGRAREHALTLVVKYSLQEVGGTMLAQPLSSRVERDFRFDPDNVLAQRSEQEMVQQEMRRVAAQQILRRLQTLSRAADTDSPPESVPAQ
jgi:LPS-assembly lipoprotein